MTFLRVLFCTLFLLLPVACTAGEAANMKQAYPIQIQLNGELQTTGDFTDLDDVPPSYTGHAGEFPIVNATETGLEFTSATSNYTDENSMDAAAAMIQNGTGITWVYNDAGDTLTPTVTASGGADNFTDLNDVPASYAGQAGKYVIVNGAETALEFTAGVGGYTDEDAQDAVGDNLTDSTTINFIYDDAGNTISANVTAAGVDHGGLAGLGDDDHTIYLLTDGTRALTGNWSVGENGLVLDPALSADGKYSGTVEAGTAGTALAFGDIVYLAVADSRWELAKADVATTSTMKLGICVQVAAGDGSATTILLWGKVRADAVFPALTVGAPVYISAATAGDIVTAAPAGTTGFVVRIIGYANTADELFFDPDKSWVELA